MFYLLLGKIRKNRRQIEFPNHEKIKRVIIFFPIDEDLFRLSLYSLRKFDFHKNNIEYYFVINQSFQNIINLNGINLFFVNYKKNKMTFCNLEEQDYLIDKGSDVTIDLNLDFYKRIFRSITGWPGGKPDSSDDGRPERSKPSKKRVLILVLD